MEKILRGDGFAIVEKDGEYQICWPQGPYNEEVSYPISRQNVEKAFKSSQDAYEVMIYAETGQWPSRTEEKAEINKVFVKKFPELLLKIPKNQDLFTESELDVLLPLAKETLLEKEAIKVIENEELYRYKKITFDGKNIEENQMGIRKTNDSWQVFCTNERGGIEIIETYKSKDDAISHLVEGLRVVKKLAQKRLRK